MKQLATINRISVGLLALCLGTLIVGGSNAWEPSAALQSAPDFNAEVAPLLAARCLNCHSGASAKGSLDLTQRAHAFAGGDSGAAIVPGRPEESLFWQRVRDDEMPPEHPLSAAERDSLRRWIENGARWSTDPIDPLRYTTSSRAGYDWWSLRPLASIHPPAHVPKTTVTNPIDRFIQQKLAAEGLNPSPSAEPRVLIRRLYFDLIGLSPTPEISAAFEADPSEAHYAAIVDRLLASPQYGERWARHWLDVARFGESQGFERNDPRNDFWPYRDWVIQALNADMPFDQFARQQVAGDLMIGDAEGAAAVGFLVAGVHNTVVGASERMRKLARQDELEEIAGAVGQAFLGLTIHCARCHDHKFDPIRNDEYYRFIAALDGVQHGRRREGRSDDEAELTRLKEALPPLQAELAVLRAKAGRQLLQKSSEANPQLAADLAAPWRTWDFEHGFSDATGQLSAHPSAGARLENGALVLTGGADSYLATDFLDRDLGEKTLEVWVQMGELEQRGGGVISVEAPEEGAFDAIVFGEIEPRRWMAGSENFSRTHSFGGLEENAPPESVTHLAMVYRNDGTTTAYRNGVPYGVSYQTGFRTFPAGRSRMLFGLRHSPAGGNRMFSGRILHANVYDQALSRSAIAASASAGPIHFDDEILRRLLSDDESRQFKELIDQRETINAAVHSLEVRRQDFDTVVPQQPGEMRVHRRGGVTDLGDVVSPGGVRAVTGDSADFGLSPTATDRERRLKLAEWITVAANPLFTRVIANRLWQHHFGTGLVETPSDFGFNGGLPSHPDLLEWLSAELHRQNYRLKPLHRLIVTSSTYRQASARNEHAMRQDANNRWLWRFSPQRIEAEVLRDSLLQAAGVLDLSEGGPGYRDVTLTALNGTTYFEPIDEDRPEFRRRTIYRFVPRGGIGTVLETFDCPDPSVASPRRSATTTPLQALSLLNSRFVLAMSSHLADRVRLEAGDDETALIRRTWRICLNRDPDPVEEQASRELVRRQGLSALARGLFNANEFVVIE